MSNPLFSVGEVVILQSVDSPDENGEYTVEMIKVGLFNDQSTGLIVEAIGYQLDGTGSQWWKQSILRKKHQPGEQSFAQLMQTLKSPVSV